MVQKPEDIELESDFLEPYDHHFARRGCGSIKWTRQDKGKRTRQKDHIIMREAGLFVPEGRPLNEWKMGDTVVVYTDEKSHRGEGKLMGVVADLLSEGVESKSWAIPCLSPIGISQRVLGVGRLFFCFKYESITSWKSNVDPTISLISPYGISELNSILRIQENLKQPLIAIDFVGGPEFKLAVDLNTAPGIPKPWVQTESRDIAESITNRLYELNETPN